MGCSPAHAASAGGVGENGVRCMWYRSWRSMIEWGDRHCWLDRKRGMSKELVFMELFDRDASIFIVTKPEFSMLKGATPRSGKCSQVHRCQYTRYFP